MVVITKTFLNKLILLVLFRVRKACHWVVNLRYFDNTILVIILISSVLLALEDPVVEDSKRNKVRNESLPQN